MEEEDINTIKQDNKTRKQEIERKRRQRITNALEELKQFIQDTTKADMRKAEKVEILESTLNLIRDKNRIDQSESFRNGYNTCLVELSGKLMTSTDIDYPTKATLLNTISKLTDHNQMLTNRSSPQPFQEQHNTVGSEHVIQNNNFSTNSINNTMPPTTLSSNRKNSTLEYENRRSSFSIVTPQVTQQPQDYSQTSQNRPCNRPRSPLTNIENKKRGRKRSIDHSDNGLVKKCKSNLDHFHSQQQTQDCWNVKAQSTINPPTTPTNNNNKHTVNEIVHKVSQNVNKNKGRLLNSHQPIDSKAEIAIIKKIEQGKLVKISRIPLTALLGNKIHQSYLMSKPKQQQQQQETRQQQETGQQLNKTDNVIRKLNSPVNTATSEKVSQRIPPAENTRQTEGQSTSNQEFSYLKLLQDNCDIDQLLQSGKFEAAPLNAVSLSPLNVFLGKY